MSWFERAVGEKVRFAGTIRSLAVYDVTAQGREPGDAVQFAIVWLTGRKERVSIVLCERDTYAGEEWSQGDDRESALETIDAAPFTLPAGVRLGTGVVSLSVPGLAIVDDEPEPVTLLRSSGPDALATPAAGWLATFTATVDPDLDHPWLVLYDAAQAPRAAFAAEMR